MNGCLRKATADSMRVGGGRGKPMKTEKNSAQELLGPLFGGSMAPQTSGPPWSWATKRGPTVQQSIYKDRCVQNI